VRAEGNRGRGKGREVKGRERECEGKRRRKGGKERGQPPQKYFCLEPLVVVPASEEQGMRSALTADFPAETEWT